MRWPSPPHSLRQACLVIGLTGLFSTVSAVELTIHDGNSGPRLVAEGNEALVLGQYERAQAAYQQALELDSKNFNALYNLGLTWQAQSNWDQARRRYEEALLVRPEHAATISNLGYIAFALGEYHEAAARFANAAQASSNRPIEAADYHYNVGAAREALGQWSDARDAYRAASELDPNHFGSLYNLGTLYMGRHLRHTPSAERYLKLALRAAPERAEPLINLGLLYQSLSRNDEAERHFDLAVNLARERQSSILNIALWRRASFNDERTPAKRVEMRRDLEELLRRDSNFPGANGMLGIHHLALGDVDKAIDLMEREVIQANFDPANEMDVDVVYRLARIYNEERPNPRRAMEYASRYYQLRPDSPQVRDLRRRVRNMSFQQSPVSETEGP